jgi:hypothetical protein
MTHAHHWRIETPNGPTSLGRCKGCGEEREFRNADTENWYVNWRSSEALALEDRRRINVEVLG